MQRAEESRRAAGFKIRVRRKVEPIPNFANIEPENGIFFGAFVEEPRRINIVI